MTRPGGRRLAALVLAITVVGLAVPVVRRYTSGRPRYRYQSMPLEASAYDALATRGWSKTSTPGANGTLNGIVRRPRSAAARWVLFYPGNDTRQLTMGQNFLTALAGDRDYGLAVFAYSGYGPSTGTANGDSMAGDGSRIFQGLVANEHLTPDRVHVVAYSMGTYLASRAMFDVAIEHAKPASFTLLSSIANIEMFPYTLLGRLTVGDVFDSRPFLREYPYDVVMLHGTADTAVSIDESRENAAQLGPRARLIELPGLTHFLLEEEATLTQVRAVIDRS